mgnify:CR=1 FL=1
MIFAPAAIRKYWPFLAIVLVCTGCGSKVFRHSGAVNMGGGINMTGDMNVNGKMDMGELKTTVSMKSSDRATPLEAVVVSGDSNRTEKIAILDVDGFLVDRAASGIGASGENPVALFREKIDAIRKDAQIKAVIVRINSPGGGVTASDIMSNELSRLKQSRDLPIAAMPCDHRRRSALVSPEQTPAQTTFRERTRQNPFPRPDKRHVNDKGSKSWPMESLT